jgi:hypothetical protein
MTIILRALTHTSPLPRALTACAIALVLWVAAWTGSYLFLSEGLLRGLMTARVPDEVLVAGPSLGATIFQWNLLFGMGAIALSSLFAVGKLSLGYVAPWWWAIGYGVALGTNSFVLTEPGKLAPDLSIVWQHIGAREILAYLLVAAALANIHFWRPRRWYDLTLRRVRGLRELRLRGIELTFVAGGLVLLAWTAGIEAAGVTAYLNR